MTVEVIVVAVMSVTGGSSTNTDGSRGCGSGNVSSCDGAKDSFPKSKMGGGAFCHSELKRCQEKCP
jgi:hypothetical protein